jgi:prepilin-type N-terminal cleavage/methylation domain-containing protein
MKRGFTLIELLIVIAIISILTIITVSQFQTAKKKANDVARKGDLSALSKALLMYYADYGKFPTSSANGQVQVTDNSLTKDIPWGLEFSDNSAQHYVYMKVMPSEKILKNTQYCYVTDPTGTKFSLFALLENTTDSQCDLTVAHAAWYTHCGGIRYCFAYVSPNAVVSDFDTYIP